MADLNIKLSHLDAGIVHTLIAQRLQNFRTLVQSGEFSDTMEDMQRANEVMERLQGLMNIFEVEPQKPVPEKLTIENGDFGKYLEDVVNSGYHE